MTMNEFHVLQMIVNFLLIGVAAALVAVNIYLMHLYRRLTSLFNQLIKVNRLIDPRVNNRGIKEKGIKE